MSDRGALYMLWGDQHEPYLQRSLASLQKHHPELPFHVHRAESGNLLDKASMYDLSPFATTLFLDVDTAVLGDLSYAFQQAERHRIACCICECPWAKRYGGISGDTVEYNTGVIAFSRKAWSLFHAWKANARTIDSSILFRGAGGEIHRMPRNDQGSFAAAVESTGFNPFVLPMNWNLRPTWHTSWFGEVKIWHDYRDVPQSVRDWNENQTRPGAVIEHVRTA